MSSSSLQRIALLFALLSATFGCNDEETLAPREIIAYTVEFVDASPMSIGAAEQPLPFNTLFTEYEVRVNVRAIGQDGAVFPTNQRLVLRSIPGEVSPKSSVIKLNNGEALNVSVQMRYAFGETRIWVEDVGLPDDPTVNECADGLDNDGDGLIDWPNDPSCGWADDVSEWPASYVTGVSPKMYFELPTVRSVQRNPDVATGHSPLMGYYVEIQGRTGHDLVVTNVVANGFYVADLADQSYNNLFIFNFSHPDDVYIGDRVCDVGGGVTEFNAFTQLQFPSWGIQGKQRSGADKRQPTPEDEEQALIQSEVEIVDCSAQYGVARLSKKLEPPAPVLLDNKLLGNLAAMERLEGAVVTVKDIELSTRFIDCDDNGSQRIESGTPEAACRTLCNKDPLCTELSSLYAYDQWRGRVGDTAEVSVSSTQLVADFDPLAGCEGPTYDADLRVNYTCPARRLTRVTGSLRQVVPTCEKIGPCDPAKESIVMFVIDPRYASDIVE
ncbi:MAG: hypothetical protein RBU37_19580 [Myxococcota bacterium]|jgi:hypothetical protein|nr:hypothetical protein [Myxococcota bacterium]